MMREILFRGKRIDNGEWVFGDLSQYTGPEPDTIEICFPIRVEDEDFNLHDDFDYTRVDPATVGQYTGLKDADGKRIFEGDIVKAVSRNYMGSMFHGEVVYKRGCYGIEYHTLPYIREFKSFHRIGETEHWQDMGASGTVTYTYEVIGNIYDHPEKLEVQHE